MADKLLEQLDRYHRINHVVENLKKKGGGRITAGLVESRIHTLDALWEKFEVYHWELKREALREAAQESLKEDPRDSSNLLSKHIYFTGNHFALAEDAYNDQRGQLQELKRTLTAPATVSTNHASQDGCEVRPRAMLPRIPLPSFEGGFKDWIPFRDRFTSLVVADAALKDVERLHYLMTCVKGEAKLLLKNMPITESNFSRAWSTLKSRYENKRLLVRAQLSALRNLPAVTKESFKDIKRLLYGTNDAVGALADLGRPVDMSADWLVHDTVEKLDRRTRREWEESLGKSDDPPALKELFEFLETRVRTLESLEQQQCRVEDQESRKQEPKKPANSTMLRVHQVSTSGSSTSVCGVCKGKNHYLLHCPQFQKQKPVERSEAVRRLGQCRNCLGRHPVESCSSPKRCQKCGNKHHTLLHEDHTEATSTVSVQHASGGLTHLHTVVLGTALVKVLAPSGLSTRARALIDPGSEVSLISERLAQALQMTRRQTSVLLRGVGSRRSRGMVQLRIVAHGGNSPVLGITALVLPRISSYRPKITRACEWAHLSGLQLADPNLEDDAPVELILGADVYSSILLDGVRRGPANTPVAQQTKLGWIVTGLVQRSARHIHTIEAGSYHCSLDRELLPMVERFWKQEEIPSYSSTLSQDELDCEEHFLKTHRRTEEGRFVVRLPFKAAPHLGESRTAALRMLEATERRFKRDPEFQRGYQLFLQEYRDLGHMYPSRATEQPHYFLPHHGVLKESSTTTKLRVVFNGSWVTSSGESLNSFLHAGPNLLPQLADVLLRWRQHKISFTADIEKMYRQIIIDQEDRRFQQILWRKDSRKPAQAFELATVTYGLTCAPYLAIRCLRLLGEEGAKNYPLGARVLLEEVYVDDVLSGADSVEEAFQKRHELCTILTAGGFNLRKWTSNSMEVLRAAGESASAITRTWEDEATHCVLGVQWSALEDCFRGYAVEIPEVPPATKRSVLSRAAQIFDPLGWLSPLTIWAKTFIQALWLLQLEWDAALPRTEQEKWKAFVEALPSVNQVRVPRWLGLSLSNERVEVHAFADASEKAYAGVVYLRVIDADDIHIAIVAAKTRVAPLQKVSLPRLELCAAVLVTQLTAHVIQTLNLEATSVNMWSDSTVVLGWIQGHPTRWKTYVANRVSEIQRALPHCVWRHIKGRENPADCASRGLEPDELPGFRLWWQGPNWLLERNWSPEPPLSYEESLDEERVTHHATAKTEEEVSDIPSRFSTIHRLLRATAWCLRWLPKSDYKGLPYITAAEVRGARERWIQAAQRQAYAKELASLREQKPLTSRSKLSPLSPFLDEKGILRLGGRLHEAALLYGAKHPVIIPSDHSLASLLAGEAHRRCLHGGTQLTLATLRQDYWIPRGRQVVKSCIARCLTCIRWRQRTPVQLMGNLPQDRVTPARPFLKTGIDYAGPFLVRSSGGRGQHAYKAYVSLFVCLTTRAVHLEVVSDASTDAFLAALKRFTARRGVCKAIYSDCGTVFKGANKALHALLPTAQQPTRLAAMVEAEGISWHFNSPGAPHFGGLWEAAVKSTKHHLRRVVGEQRLTYEELATLLAGIEACLNSRPLQPLSDDPGDFSVLTPGHFLIGEPLTSIPEADLEDVPSSRLSRWQMVQQMQQHFWRRWATEYLHSLQPRGKWRQQQASPKEGEMCLLRDELSSPARWPLARIVGVHPGSDGLTRVVTVQTTKGKYKRPINKIVLLPFSASLGAEAAGPSSDSDVAAS